MDSSQPLFTVNGKTIPEKSFQNKPLSNKVFHSLYISGKFNYSISEDQSISDFECEPTTNIQIKTVLRAGTLILEAFGDSDSNEIVSIKCHKIPKNITSNDVKSIHITGITSNSNFEFSGDSDIAVSGNSAQCTLKVYGNCILDLSALNANSLNLSSYGTNQITANASESAFVYSIGKNNISISGNPELKSVSSSGSNTTLFRKWR